jgi:hypothetical protein
LFCSPEGNFNVRVVGLAILGGGGGVTILFGGSVRIFCGASVLLPAGGDAVMQLPSRGASPLGHPQWPFSTTSPRTVQVGLSRVPGAIGAGVPGVISAGGAGVIGRIGVVASPGMQPPLLGSRISPGRH